MTPGVAIVTTGRNPPLLRRLIAEWLGLGHSVVCALPDAALVAEAPGLCVLRLPTSGRDFGVAWDAAIDACPPGDVYLGADDVLPCGGDWSGLAKAPADAICAVRLVSATGQRWADWARFDGLRVENLAYDVRDPGAYISGNAMVLRGRARDVVRWSGRGWHHGDDILASWGAVQAGIALIPPFAGGAAACPPRSPATMQRRP